MNSNTNTPTPIYPDREIVKYDIVIVGGGPAGLSAAIRLKQLALKNQAELSVCVLEKASEIGAHTLSGAVVDPRALTELIPDWVQRGAPLTQKISRDRFLFLSADKAYASPSFLLPDSMRNEGCYVARLGYLVAWMGEQAQDLGVDVFPGFAAAEILFDANGAVQGVASGDAGLNKDGTPNASFERGMALHAKYTLFAEGSRGHLGRQLIERFQLDQHAHPQTYALGLKELWQIDPAQHRPGEVLHTAGWPLDPQTYGGGFVYHLGDPQQSLISIGYVVGLDYQNPTLSPFEEFQRWKTHPAIKKILVGGQRLAYGARSITAGGLLSLPQTVFAGGALIGCEAGYLNASRIKGSHAAIKTGLLAADAAFEAIQAGRQQDVLNAYPCSFKESWLHTELDRARNFKAWFKMGLWAGMLMSFVEQWLLPRLSIKRPPWTLGQAKSKRKTDQGDHARLLPKGLYKALSYLKPDGVVTFDRLSSIFLSQIKHDERQPIHLTLKNTRTPVTVNLTQYGGPEALYCPAGVYEFLHQADGSYTLQINAQNCIHCKTCDIKDPTQNIVWVAPEGGSGPHYSGM